MNGGPALGGRPAATASVSEGRLCGMPPVVDQAVVLRHWEYSETSQTVSLLTRAHGVVRGLAKGARREKGSFCGGFEVLTRGEIVFIPRETTDLSLLTEWDLQEVFWATRRDLQAHRIGFYMIDLVHHAVTASDPHPGLFDELVLRLGELEDEGRREEALLRFQWGLLVETGYQPRLSWDPGARTLGFNPLTGQVVADPGRSPSGTVWRVRGETVRLLAAVGDGVDPLEHSASTVDRANRLLSAYLRTVLDRDLPTRAALFGKQ